MLRNEGDRLTRVVVCSPGKEYFRVDQLKAHNIRQISDSLLAKEQHKALREQLIQSGCQVIDVPELTNHPNSVFTMDTAVVTPEGYIQMRMGLDTRRDEERWMAEHLNALGVPKVGTIEKPATVEGGDVILAGSVAFVGMSSRTTEAGIHQLVRLLKPMGYQIRHTLVPPPFLHIGGAMTMIGPRRILCCEGVFPPGFFEGFETIEISAAGFISGNVINLGADRVIADQKNSVAISALEAAGIEVYPLNFSEFVKGTGGPSCLIMPLERD